MIPSGVARALARASLLFLLACPAACNSALSSQITRTGALAPAKPPDSPVALYFWTMGVPNRPSVEVGLIRVEPTASLDEVLVEAEARARELGADAIIVDFRYHYQSLPVTFDVAGAPHVPNTPRLNANVIAISYVQEPYPADVDGR